jgi:Raf kinase inhibitor-like YbhB/YbcL family protein
MARATRWAGLAGLVASVLLVSALPAGAAPRKPFTVTSPAFRDGKPIPDGFTCSGANASLPLAWRNVPKGTKQLALVMDDPDAPVGTFVHWVAWGIRPKPPRLPEETLPAGVVEGTPSYIGPCPPPGGGPHHYRLTVYALDAPPAVTAGDADAAALRAAIKGHVLAKDRLTGTFER